MKIKLKKTRLDAKIPTRPDDGSGAYDLYSLTAIAIPPHCTTSLSIGIAIEIPLGYAGIIYTRSGMGRQGFNKHGGFIDSSYRGEISVLLHNTTTEMKYINLNERVAQLAIQKVEDLEFEEVEELSQTERGDKGYGSSGN